jgi:hypothetical protein
MARLRRIKTVPVPVEGLTEVRVGWWGLLTSGAADVAIAADAGLLPDLENWGRSGNGTNITAEYVNRGSRDGHVEIGSF